MLTSKYLAHKTGSTTVLDYATDHIICFQQKCRPLGSELALQGPFGHVWPVKWAGRVSFLWCKAIVTWCDSRAGSYCSHRQKRALSVISTQERSEDVRKKEEDKEGEGRRTGGNFHLSFSSAVMMLNSDRQIMSQWSSTLTFAFMWKFATISILCYVIQLTFDHQNLISLYF